MSGENREIQEIQTLPPARRPFQFSLRTMFAMTACWAIACAVLFQVPSWAALPVLVLCSVAYSAVLTTVLIYGHSYLRTFCVGALFLSVFLLPPISPLSGYKLFAVTKFTDLTEEDFRPVRVIFGVGWLSSILVGLLCVGVRRAIERQAEQR